MQVGTGGLVERVWRAPFLRRESVAAFVESFTPEAAGWRINGAHEFLHTVQRYAAVGEHGDGHGDGGGLDAGGSGGEQG